MTYRELLCQLQALPQEALDFDITLHDLQHDEFLTGQLVTDWNPETHSAGGVVDDGTPLLQF